MAILISTNMISRLIIALLYSAILSSVCVKIYFAKCYQQKLDKYKAKAMHFQAPRGTIDILPQDQEYWSLMRKASQEISESLGNLVKSRKSQVILRHIKKSRKSEEIS